MKNSSLILLLALIAFSCTPNVAKIDNSIKKYFDAENVEGTYAFMNNQRGDVTVYNMEMDTQRISPGSIFKIAEVLIGIETSRLTDGDTKMPVGDTGFSKLTLKEAFDQNDSTYMRLLANGIGLDTMKFWLDTLNYGTKNATDINSFWKDGELKISPDEQLGLVYKIYFDKLPFQKYAQQIVRELMLKEDNTLYKYSYTTGTARDNQNRDIGWIAGWIEENRHVYFFVSVVRPQDAGRNPEKIAESMIKKILTDKGFFKGEM